MLVQQRHTVDLVCKLYQLIFT